MPPHWSANPHDPAGHWGVHGGGGGGGPMHFPLVQTWLPGQGPSQWQTVPLILTVSQTVPSQISPQFGGGGGAGGIASLTTCCALEV
jgi:hypothetical protein